MQENHGIPGGFLRRRQVCHEARHLQPLPGLNVGATLVTTEMVGFEWLRDAADPRFRELLRLVK